MLGVVATFGLVGATALKPSASPKSSRVITFIGDSSTSAIYSPPGYPVLVARNLGVRIHNLATISETRNIASYDVQQALAEELPQLPSDTTDAVVFLGIDDLTALLQGSESLADAEAAYAKIIDILKARHVAIHLITVRNYILDPNYPFRPKNEADGQAGMQRIVDVFDDWIVSLGYPTLDIRKVPDLLDNTTYKDGVHLSPLGLVRLAAHITPWFTTPAQLAAKVSSTHRRRVITFVGDVHSSDRYSPPGFPVLVGTTLQLPIHNLSAPNYFIVGALQEQLPKLSGDTTDAVLSLGTEDLAKIAAKEETLADVERRVLAIVEILKFQHISVYFVTPRAFGGDPDLLNPPPASLWVGMKSAEVELSDWELSLGYPVLDLRKYPDLTAQINYANGHLSAQGLQRVASYVAKWFQRCDDQGRCTTIATT